jgi:hypothetical protein
VSTFDELREQAEREIRAHIRSTSSDSTHHFVVDSTNYFVDHGAGLLAALRVWGESRRKTDVCRERRGRAGRATIRAASTVRLACDRYRVVGVAMSGVSAFWSSTSTGGACDGNV